MRLSWTDSDSSIQKKKKELKCGVFKKILAPFVNNVRFYLCNILGSWHISWANPCQPYFLFCNLSPNWLGTPILPWPQGFMDLLRLGLNIKVLRILKELWQSGLKFPTFEFWFELDWLGAKFKGKKLLVIEISFTVERYCTFTVQFWCSVSKAKHDWVFSAALLNKCKIQISLQLPDRDLIWRFASMAHWTLR